MGISAFNLYRRKAAETAAAEAAAREEAERLEKKKAEEAEAAIRATEPNFDGMTSNELAIFAAKNKFPNPSLSSRGELSHKEKVEWVRNKYRETKTEKK